MAQVQQKPDRDRSSTISLEPKWYTVQQVAQMLGYGPSKVRMLIVQGDLRSLKDGGSRRILPEWVDEYIRERAERASERWLR
jgi:excisionase family DNA binding protein